MLAAVHCILRFRFPQKSMMNSFFVLAMRPINFVKDPEDFGNTEIEELLKHFGEEKVHLKAKISSR